MNVTVIVVPNHKINVFPSHLDISLHRFKIRIITNIGVMDISVLTEVLKNCLPIQNRYRIIDYLSI